MHTLQEWAEWIDSLEEKGYGRMNKDEWHQWVASMQQTHGPPTKKEKGQPSQGQPAKGPIALKDLPDSPELAFKDSEDCDDSQQPGQPSQGSQGQPSQGKPAKGKRRVRALKTRMESSHDSESSH